MPTTAGGRVTENDVAEAYVDARRLGMHGQLVARAGSSETAEQIELLTSTRVGVDPLLEPDEWLLTESKRNRRPHRR